MTAQFESSGVPSAEVLAELEKVLASAFFDASDRNKRFLRFVVTEALAGRADHIKAYTIATVVFGRDASFDPQTDPIIRIEASRLRRALEHYYLTGGKDSAIRIEIPKGSYVPEIAIRGEPARPTAPLPAAVDAVHAPTAPLAPPAPSPPMGPRVGPVVLFKRLAMQPWQLAAASAAFAALIVAMAGFFAWPILAGNGAAEPAPARRGPSILVMPFEDDGSTPAYAAVAKGFTREVVVSLTRFKDLFVYADQTSLRVAAEAPGKSELGDLNVDYILSGALSVTEHRFRGTVSLVDAKSRRHLWSDRFDAPLSPENIFSTREDIAARVTQALAQPYGVIFSEKVKALAGKPPSHLSSYECVVRFYAYQRAMAAAEYDGVRRCLERTVAAEPGYALALSSLAIVYVDAHRFAFAHGKVFSPLLRARELAQRAIDQSPEEPHGYKAMHNVLWLMNDVPGSLAMGERAVALNPYDTEAIGDLGTRRYYSGDWEGGLTLIGEALKRNPAAPDGYRIPLVLNAYMQGRYADALAEAQRISLPNFIYAHVLVAMAAASVGREHESAAAVQRILAIDPAFATNAVADLRMRNQHPSIIRAVAEGLSRAGLVIEGASEISDRGW